MRWTDRRVALLLSLAACGPQAPDEGATASTGAATTGAASTTDPTTTTTPAPSDTTIAEATTTTAATTTAATDAAMSTAAATGGTIAMTSEPDSGDATTAAGPCVADPAQGICSAACDLFEDCCQCAGRNFVLDPAAPSCALAMGIVTAACPWSPWAVHADGATELEELALCAGEPGYAVFETDGDVVVQLCGSTCDAYLAGALTTIEVEMFCEVA